MAKWFKFQAFYEEHYKHDTLSVFLLPGGDYTPGPAGEAVIVYAIRVNKENGNFMTHEMPNPWSAKGEELPQPVKERIAFVIDQIATRRDEELKYDEVHFTVEIPE